jgi:hypothetical protein
MNNNPSPPKKKNQGSLRYCAKAGVHLFGGGSDQGEFLRALFAVMEVATESHAMVWGAS